MALSVIFLILGLCFTGIAIYEYSKINKLTRDCVSRTIGTVDSTDIKWQGGASFPLFSFLANGKKYLISHKRGGEVREGSTVTVYYDPANPKRHYVAENKKEQHSWKPLLVIGVALFVLSYFLRGVI